MTPGQIVKIFSSQTTDGHRQYQGQAVILQKLGDAQDFYKVRMLEDNVIAVTFVYDDEQHAQEFALRLVK